MDTILDKLKNERVDYTQLGFDSNGLRQPISREIISANQFDQQENSVFSGSVRNASITNAKIKDMSADKIKTGTLDSIIVSTDEIYDKTYDLPGVFVKQIKTTSFANQNILVAPDNGGLLTVQANYRSIAGGQFWWLTPVNHFYVFKSGGYYYIYHAGTQIDADTNADTVYYTCLFNSLESGNGY